MKNNKPNIAFVLPVPNNKIIGGYKVIYDYANYLAQLNFANITIIYNAHKGENSLHIPKLITYFIRLIIGKYGPSWVKVNHNINKVVKFSYDNYLFEEYDVLIATATETASFVNQFQGKKMYFLQGYENWNGVTEEQVDRTFQYDMKIIAISKWLVAKVKNVSKNEALYIPNGIDNKIFNVSIPISKRNPHSLCALYHDDPIKGCDILLEIIFDLKNKYSDFEVYLFGYPKRPKNWPKWIHYEQKANARTVSYLMNKSRVFCCTSRQEGFGLTGLESIFSGCVLVTTDCLGVREYANEDNSFICGVDDKEGLYNSIITCFENNEICEKKLRQCEFIKDNFNINNSRDMFSNELLELIREE